LGAYNKYIIMADNTNITEESSKIRRQIFVIWFILLVGSLLILYIFNKYSPLLIESLELHNPRVITENINTLVSSKKYDEALSQATQAVQFFPSDYSFFILLGDVYEHKEQYKEALDAYQKAYKLAVDNWEPVFRIGVLQYKLQQLPESVASLQKAVERNSTDRWVYNALGYSAYANNQLDIAFDAWIHARDMVPNEPIYYYNIAMIHGKKKEWDKVLELCQKAISLDSSYMDAYTLAAESLYQLGDYGQAQKYWNQVLEKNPKDTKALEGLARIKDHKKK
jgi:tetratricopeptide (TPR) repeat protein